MKRKKTMASPNGFWIDLSIPTPRLEHPRTTPGLFERTFSPGAGGEDWAAFAGASIRLNLAREIDEGRGPDAVGFRIVV